jgi:hypothetical protein
MGKGSWTKQNSKVRRANDERSAAANAAAGTTIHAGLFLFSYLDIEYVAALILSSWSALTA